MFVIRNHSYVWPEIFKLKNTYFFLVVESNVMFQNKILVHLINMVSFNSKSSRLSCWPDVSLEFNVYAKKTHYKTQILFEKLSQITSKTLILPIF